MSCPESKRTNLPGHSKPFWKLLACIWLVLNCGTVCPAETLRWENLTSSFTVRSGYDDNIVMSTIEPQSDTVNTATSSIRYDYTTERFNSAVTLRLSQWLYTEESELNTLDQQYSLGLGYKLTPRLSLNLSGSYKEDTTLEEELEAAGYVAKRTDRLYATGSGSMSYQWSERTSLDLSYSNFRYWYDHPLYSDTVIHQGTTGITHQFKNMRTSALLQGAYSRYEYEEARSDDYQILIGLRHLFSETFDLMALGGISYSRSQFSSTILVPVRIGPFIFSRLARMDERTTDTGWRANITATKKWEKSTARLGFVRDLSTSSYGYTIERSRASFNLDHQLTERLKVALAANYYLSESQGGRREANEWRSLSIRPTVRYQIRQDLSIELSYQYTDSENRLSHTGADRNRFFFQFYLEWPG